MKISYSFGIMDLFHYGHLRALKLASDGADLHVVGLVSDTAARAWVGNIVSSEFERRKVLESLNCVDWVMPQKSLDPTENLKKLHYIYPEAEITLFRGDGISVVAAREYLKSIGGRVQSIDYYENLSPTQIMSVLNSRKEDSIRTTGIISTKADTLLALKDRLTLSRIEDIYVFRIKDFIASPAKILSEIRNLYDGSIIIRSSSLREDSFESSNAGHYQSVANINPKDSTQVLEAIQTVRQSYIKDSQEEDTTEQILVQSQAENIKYSGVIFTRDINNSLPYYVINYDDSGSTDSVTSGQSGKSIYIAHDTEINAVPDEWKNLFLAVKELESILSRMMLDIEFAVNHDGEVIIFQVRPLAASYKYGKSAVTNEVLSYKNDIKSQYIHFSHITGTNILSDMAFWNPAEIIGQNPHRLDYSLYRDIITRQAWNEGLIPLGYDSVKHDLMYRLGNKPFISLDYSFMSLIPSGLESSIKHKLKDYYLAKLQKDFTAHDKIEFEITLSCFDFMTDDRLQELADNNFSENETASIRQSLLELTRRSIKNYPDILRQDMASLDELERIRLKAEERISGLSIMELASLTGKLLDAVKTYGTPQFSRQARLAFIARSLCTTLRAKGFWTPQEHDAFMSGISTVASELVQDMQTMTHEDFNRKYGHLRAGTYDITMPRYDMQESFSGRKAHREPEQVIHSHSYAQGLDDALKSSGLDIPVDDVIAFMKSALEQREYFKFIFTRTLSRAIEIIAMIAEKLGFTRRDISYFDVKEIIGFKSYNTDEDIADYINELLPFRKEKYADYSKVIIPGVISSANDFDFVRTDSARPNFITNKKISAECVLLDSDNKNAELEGKIVLIEKADPGFDWIFTKSIAGLITRYGGAASHMAIRCAEFEIPAAIGCGEKFSGLARVHGVIELDCKNGVIKS